MLQAVSISHNPNTLEKNMSDTPLHVRLALVGLTFQPTDRRIKSNRTQWKIRWAGQDIWVPSVCCQQKDLIEKKKPMMQAVVNDMKMLVREYKLCGLKELSEEDLKKF